MADSLREQKTDEFEDAHKSGIGDKIIALQWFSWNSTCTAVGTGVGIW
jgi:hypothetical protein